MLSAGAVGEDHAAPVAVPGAGGGFLISWVAWKDDFRIGVYSAEMDAGGQMGTPFRVNQQRMGAQNWPAVAVAPDHGKHLVAWVGFDDAGHLGVEGRLLDAADTTPDALCTAVGGLRPIDQVRQLLICPRR